MFLLSFIVRRKALPFRCIAVAKSSKISSNYKDRKNSDTFLPASVKLAVTSVLYTILRRSGTAGPLSICEDRALRCRAPFIPTGCPFGCTVSFVHRHSPTRKAHNHQKGRQRKIPRSNHAGRAVRHRNRISSGLHLNRCSPLLMIPITDRNGTLPPSRHYRRDTRIRA